jgi:hypothetical protein
MTRAALRSLSQSPAALAPEDPVPKRELVKSPAGEALLGGGLVPLHGDRCCEAVPQPRFQSTYPRGVDLPTEKRGPSLHEVLLEDNLLVALEEG